MATDDVSDDVSDVVTDDLSDDLSDASDDLSDDVSDDTLTEDLRAWIDEYYPESNDLAEGIGTVENSADNLQVTLTLSQTTDADTAVEICGLTVLWAFADGSFEDDVAVEVEDQDDTVLAAGDFVSGCEAP